MSGWELTGWAIFAFVIFTAFYYAACMLWPFTYCRRCSGSGKRRSPFGKNHGRCRKCKGRGERLRFGRRLANRIGIAKKKLVG